MTETKQGKEKDSFITITMPKKKTPFETIYGKMRSKRKIIEKLLKRIKELDKGNSDHWKEARLLETHIEELKKDLSGLWDQFRGKVKEKVKNTITISMTVDNAINYLAFLTNEDAIKYDSDIRYILDCIENTKGICFDTKDELYLARLKENLKYIKENRNKC